MVVDKQGSVQVTRVFPQRIDAIYGGDRCQRNVLLKEIGTELLQTQTDVIVTAVTTSSEDNWQPFDVHCCHMGTAVKHPVPDRNFWHPGTLTLSPERKSTRMSKIYKQRLILVWHRMLNSCTHMTTVDVEGLKSRTLHHFQRTPTWNRQMLACFDWLPICRWRQNHWCLLSEALDCEELDHSCYSLPTKDFLIS